MIIQVYNDATDKLDLRAEGNDFTRGEKFSAKLSFKYIGMDLKNYRNKPGMKICKKTTLPQNDDRKERQKDYPYLHMHQV